MSDQSPFDSDFNSNPYSPTAQGTGTQTVGGIPLPAGQKRGMVNQVTVLGVLMVIQGVIDLLAGAVVAVYAWLMPTIFDELQKQQAAQGGGPGPPMPPDMSMYMAIGGSILAAAIVLAGILLIYSGIGVTRFERRTTAFVALAGGMITLLTCYCFPTSLALAIYGMIVLLSQPVTLAFSIRQQGHDPGEIQRAFLNLPK